MAVHPGRPPIHLRLIDKELFKQELANWRSQLQAWKTDYQNGTVPGLNGRTIAQERSRSGRGQG